MNGLFELSYGPPTDRKAGWSWVTNYNRDTKPTLDSEIQPCIIHGVKLEECFR